MKKIDIHAHITNRPLENILQQSAWIDTLKEEMERYDIERTVVLASYFPHRGTGISNFRLYHWIKDENNIVMFGSLDFEHYFCQGYNELEELADMNAIKGIKLYTTYQKIDFSSKRMSELMKLAERKNLLIMFHSGTPHFGSKYNNASYELLEPGKVEILAGDYDVNFIISHLGWTHLDDMKRVLARNPNIYTDMSGMLASKTEKTTHFERSVGYLHRLLARVGPGKILFGTDFPVQTHSDSIQIVEAAMGDFSIPDRKKVYYDNAQLLLGGK